MKTTAPVSIRKQAVETLAMIKNKLWLEDWLAREKMLSKCEVGEKELLGGKRILHISERGC